MKKNKILLFDIETAPNLAYVWGKWEQDVIAYEREWYMMTFSVKWLGEDKVSAYALPDFKKTYSKDKTNDKELLLKLREYLDEADIVIAHNGDDFDVRKTNARFIAHGILPPSPYKTIDTKKIAKRYFNFNSNKLTDLGEYLNVGKKLETGGFGLWKGCMEGDKEAWKLMVKYNKQDVVLLEEIYLKLLPWMTQHPNRAIFEGHEHACPNCSSHKVQARGFAYTRTMKYQRYQCTNCGAWSRARTGEPDFAKPELV